MTINNNNNPASPRKHDMWINPKTNEVFIYDGKMWVKR